MISTLSTTDPDTGHPIPVTVEWTNVPVIEVRLYRKSVEGNRRALNADVMFGPVVGALASRQDLAFNINLDVRTAGHEVPMTDGDNPIMLEDLQEVWKLASTSGGDGAIQSVAISTTLY